MRLGEHRVDCGAKHRIVLAPLAHAEPLDRLAGMLRERRDEQVAVAGHDRPRHASDRRDLAATARSHSHHVEERTIWNRRPMRHVLGLGDGVAGHAEGKKKRLLLRREVISPTRPARVGLGVEDMRVFHARRGLRERPGDSLAGLELAAQQLPEQREVPNIVGGVPHL